MAKKKFKTESKKLLDMMINSIYTHKEVFLRELISNASDACDKLRFRSLTDDSVKVPQDGYEIWIEADKDARTITISDNGCGMTMEELEKNLGTIAKSGSYDFKKEQEDEQDETDVTIIGQFGVGFYSAFMVADKITVVSKAYGEKKASRWESEGVEGYTIEECEAGDEAGTTITLRIKEDTDEENYSEFLDEWKLRELVKKYSDYIHYPIKMKGEEEETLNSMVPIWKRAQSDVTDEEYANFYQDKFYDYEAPLKVIRQKSEGTPAFESLLFIPAAAPYNYYTRDFEKGLQLYSSGVMIMDRCKDLVPDYFSFVKGLVDSDDLTLNISRETLQHDRQLKVIAKAIERKIVAELKKMQEGARDDYEKFYGAFGTQLKYGIYSDFGMHKDVLQDLVMFKSSYEAGNIDAAEKETDENKYVAQYVTLKEYVSRMKEEQEKIYFCAGDTIDKIKMLPQVEAALSRGYEVLYLTEEVDEFALMMMREYDGKSFANVTADDTDLSTDAEKELIKQENESSKDILAAMKEAIGEGVKDVKFTNTLGTHPVCLSNEGELSANMEKTLSKMPGADAGIKAELVLEINLNHPIAERLKNLYDSDKDRLAKYAKVLYMQARLISGMPVENPTEACDIICDIMVE